MKVAVIFLDYLRHDHTEKALASLNESGHPFDLVTVDMKGIAAAINHGILKTLQYDGVVTAANDIKMPTNWLAKMVEYAEAIPTTGMVGIHCVEGQGNPTTVNGIRVNQTFCPFGNVLITRKAIDTIGYFSDEFDPYGMQDSDYGYRLIKTGFTNYYIPGMMSEHIGHDVGDQTDYRKMKDEGLMNVGKVWETLTRGYDETNNYKK